MSLLALMDGECVPSPVRPCGTEFELSGGATRHFEEAVPAEVQRERPITVIGLATQHPSHELRRIIRLIEVNQVQLLEAWNEYHSA